MVNKTTRNSELRIDLASLIKYNSAAQTVNLNSIELYYERSEVVWTLPPQANLESSTVTAIWIDRVRYPGVAAWTAGWARAVRSNQAQGIAVSVGRPRTVTAVNLAKPDGTRLTASAVTPAAVTTTTIPTVQQVTTAPQLSVPGPRGDTGAAGLRGLQGLTGDRGPTGLQGVGVQTLAVNEQGNLIVTLSNSATVDAGYVVGPSPVLTVGTVMAGATPSVSITGGPTNYALNFVLQAGPAGPGSGDVSTLSLYDDPVWINSLAGSKVTNAVLTTGTYSDPSWLTLTAAKVGLGNVTNESKATMFSSPAFTGTVSGVTATHVGLGNVTNESKATMFASPTFTGTVTAPTVLLSSGGFSITQSGTKLLFKYNGVDIASMDSSGNFITSANITAFGTP